MPGKKRPIGYSTLAEEQLVNYLAEEIGTVSELYLELAKTPLTLKTAEIVKKYVDVGYRETRAFNLFFEEKSKLKEIKKQGGRL